jgi:C4-dicarboxylate-specific signal transduction histidine kinase
MSQRPPRGVSDTLAALLERLEKEGFTSELCAEATTLCAHLAELEREARALEEVAMTASKLAELQRESAALNHELRQPMVAIKALAQFMVEDLADPEAESEAMAERAQQMVLQADRMARLLVGFRGTSFSPSQPDASADVHQVVRAVEKLLAYRLTRRVKLDIEIEPNLPRVRCPADRLEQTLLNLIVNAIDAVEERGIPGGVVIRTQVGAPSFVDVFIGDEGAGIPSHVRERLFSPYVTTKGHDRGTGLGLVICRELLRAVGGSVELCEPEAIEALAPWPRPIRTLFRARLPV